MTFKLRLKKINVKKYKIMFITSVILSIMSVSIDLGLRGLRIHFLFNEKSCNRFKHNLVHDSQ